MLTASMTDRMQASLVPHDIDEILQKIKNERTQQLTNTWLTARKVGSLVTRLADVCASRSNLQLSGKQARHTCRQTKRSNFSSPARCITVQKTEVCSLSTACLITVSRSHSNKIQSRSNEGTLTGGCSSRQASLHADETKLALPGQTERMIPAKAT